MAKILQASGNASGTTLASGNTVFVPCANCYTSAETVSFSTEAFAQLTYRTAGVLSNLWCNVRSNSLNGTTTVKSRIGGVNGNQSISIPTATTGNFQDSSNTDSISAGNQVNISVDTTGSGSGTTIISTIATTFSATSDTAIRLSYPASVAVTGSSPNFRPLGGHYESSSTNENNTLQYIGADGTLKNLYVYVSANTKTTTTTIISRVDNGGGPANGNLTVSIITLLTGVFEDTTNSDAILAGYLTDLQLTFGATGAITINQFSTEFITTNNKSLLLSARSGAGWISGPTLTRFGPIGGAAEPGLATTETFVTIASLVKLTASLLSVFASVNASDGTTTVNLRKNTTTDTALSVSIATTSTGRFTDNVNMASVAASDVLSLKYVNGGTAGNVTFRTTSMLANYSVGAIKDMLTNRGIIPYSR